MSTENFQPDAGQEVNHTKESAIVTDPKEGRIITVVMTDDGITVKEQAA